MSERISSSDWAGPIDKKVRRGAFTYSAGEFGGTTDYAWLRRKEPFTLAPPPKLRGIFRLAAWLLVAPLLLAAAWFAGEIGVRDVVVSDPSGYLLLWGGLTVAMAFWQLMSRSLHWIAARTFMLGLLMAATVGISIGYAIVAQRAYGEAVVGQPQRVFRYVAGTKPTLFRKHSPEFRHQRADGTDLEGASKRPPLPHGQCITARPISGAYGFRWLRITEQLPPRRGGQLSWPVRREDCFSNGPLSELGG